MSYKLEKPYTEKDKMDFIVEYNHNQGLELFETDEALYALEPNEIVQDGEIVINPDYDAEQAQKERLARIDEIKNALRVNDLHLIRALASPTEIREETGETWLEYYKAQATNLRNEMNSLENEERSKL